MKIRSLVVVCAVLGLASGCDSRKETAADATPEAAVAAQIEAAPPEASAPTCGQGEGYDRLPSGICMQPRFDVRSVRQYQDKQERERTRVTFAYSNGVDDVMGATANALTAAGYRKREAENKANGSILVPFTKDGSGTTYLEVKPSADGDMPSSGTFFIDFRDGPDDAVGDPQASAG